MEIREGKYCVKLAQTPAEKHQVYALRHDVYCKELHFSRKTYDHEQYAVTESDYFDKLCDHLIIRDEQQNRCVGTFRFLSGGNYRKDADFTQNNGSI